MRLTIVAFAFTTNAELTKTTIEVDATVPLLPQLQAAFGSKTCAYFSAACGIIEPELSAVMLGIDEGEPVDVLWPRPGVSNVPTMALGINPTMWQCFDFRPQPVV